MSSPARAMLENLRPSRSRGAVRRTLGGAEVEQRLERLARMRGEQALDELRDEARAIAAALGAESEFERLDALIGALLGTRDAPLKTAAGRARGAGLGYDPDRLARFEILRAELAAQPLPERPAPDDPRRQFAFFEAYFSNWIEGTMFEVEEAEEIVFKGRIPPQRPADAHDIQGTFDAITDSRLRATVPRDADDRGARVIDPAATSSAAEPRSSCASERVHPRFACTSAAAQLEEIERAVGVLELGDGALVTILDLRGSVAPRYSGVASSSSVPNGSRT